MRFEDVAGVEGVKQELLDYLAMAVELEDARAVEDALDEAHRTGVDATIVPVLLDLLERDFHTRHEDIVLTLQCLKDPRAVDALGRAALVLHPHLDYDENFGLARKCTWALADIGTPAARAMLQTLAANNNEIIAAYAQKRLVLWAKELARNGHTELST